MSIINSCHPERMGDYVFIRDDEAEITFVEDEEDDLQDVQEEVETYYEENFWPKDDKESCGFTFKGKKKIFNKAVENLVICFKNKGKLKEMAKLTFKTMDNRKTKNGSEIDVEITKNKERGIAVLKIFGPKKESTIMINKSKKHDVKFVSILAVEIIKPLLDKFISGEGWKDLFTKSTSNVQKHLCKKCDKSFVSVNNLKIHMKKYHTSVTFRSIQSKPVNSLKNIGIGETKEPMIEMEVEENDLKAYDIKEIDEKMDIDGPVIGVKDNLEKSKQEQENMERSRKKDEQIIEKTKKLEEKEKIFEQEKIEKEKRRTQSEKEKEEKEKKYKKKK